MRKGPMTVTRLLSEMVVHLDGEGDERVKVPRAFSERHGMSELAA